MDFSSCNLNLVRRMSRIHNLRKGVRWIKSRLLAHFSGIPPSKGDWRNIIRATHPSLLGSLVCATVVVLLPLHYRDMLGFVCQNFYRTLCLIFRLYNLLITL